MECATASRACSIAIVINVTTDDWSMLGQGAAPGDWQERRGEYIQSYLDRCRDAASALAPTADVEVLGGADATRVRVTIEPEDMRAAEDLEESVAAAVGQAWVNWSCEL